MVNLDGLEQFLIEKSDINKEFIEDFFGFQKNDLYVEYKPFVVDLNNVAKWLETRKDNIKVVLKDNFNKNLDYIIKNDLLLNSQEQKTDNRGGRNKETILLTTECFKKLCMKSGTKKADQVREYYLELEKLIDQYKDIIIEKQNREIKVLKNDLRKDDYPKDGYTYVYEETDEFGKKYYRNGKSNELKKRMASHNSSSIHKKILVFKIKSSNKKHYEACLNALLYDFRYKHNKDYFDVSFDLLKNAVADCENIVKNFKNNNLERLKGGGDNNKSIKDMTSEEFKIWNKNTNTNIKIMFSEMCECVRWNIFDSPEEAYNKGKQISTRKLNSTILERTMGNKVLIVPSDRDENYYEFITISENKVTYRQLFKYLYKFYDEEMTLDKLNKIPNDYWDYVKDAKIDIKNGKHVKRSDIMGNLCRYEDICNVYNNIYLIILGS